MFIRQDDQRSDLQKRVADELQEKLKHDKPLEYEKPVNNLEQNTQTSRHLGLWVTLIIMLVALLIFATVIF